MTLANSINAKGHGGPPCCAGSFLISTASSPPASSRWNPALRDKPIIVVPTMAETTCAIAASYPAKALGIKTGTLVHEARRLCPDVKLVQAHHKLYVEYHHRILTAIDKHIPVEEVMSIDEVACRLDRRQQEFGLRRSWRRTSRRKFRARSARA